MRGTKSLLLGGATLLSAATNVLAATFLTGPFEVKSVVIGGYGAHVQIAHPNLSGQLPPSCTQNWEGTQLVVLRESPNYKEMLAGFMTAQATNRPVAIWFEVQGNGTCGWGNQLRIDAVQIKSW